MADIKERKKDTSSIKEKRTSVPKELLKKETIHSIQWARQQVQEAAERDPQENERAGARIPRLSAPQIRQPSRSKLKRETHDTSTTLRENQHPAECKKATLTPKNRDVSWRSVKRRKRPKKSRSERKM